MNPRGEVSRTDTGIGASWRVTVLTEAERLGSELDDAVTVGAVGAVEGGAEERTASIRSAIGRARTVATDKTGWCPIRRMMDWWAGTSIELAWQSLHLAQEQLAVLQDPAVLRAQALHLKNLASATFGAERAAEEARLIDSWSDRQPDALVARRILAAAHAHSDAQHQNVRVLRNTLYALFLIVSAIDGALWGAGVTVGAVVGLGALGGAVSVVFALRGAPPAGPYNTLPPQTLLKIASGAATAIMAVKILDFANASAALSVSRDEFYAVIFGFSQQAFTRLVDQRADDLSKSTTPRATTAVEPNAPGSTRR